MDATSQTAKLSKRIEGKGIKQTTTKERKSRCTTCGCSRGPAARVFYELSAVRRFGIGAGCAHIGDLQISRNLAVQLIGLRVYLVSPG